MRFLKMKMPMLNDVCETESSQRPSKGARLSLSSGLGWRQSSSPGDSLRSGGTLNKRLCTSNRWRTVSCQKRIQKHRTVHSTKCSSQNGLVVLEKSVGQGLSRSCHDVSVHHSNELDNRGLLGSQQELHRLGQRRNMKKSETRLPVLKKFISRSPNLPKRQLSPENSLGKPRSSTLNIPDEAGCSIQLSRSLDDLEKDDDSGTKENGSACSDTTDDIDGPGGAMDGETSRKWAAIEHIQEKITRTMDQIKEEQATKEANVNEYLRLAGEADKQQLLRIKQVFEKKNQKSTQSLSTLQKKLEKYTKALHDVQTYGAHKQARDKLKDMGQGLKDVGANIVDGITGFSGGVVGNIKGAKETIVSKPKEFAHLIKNRFGSADNISSMKVGEDGQAEDGEKSQGGGTLPAREVTFTGKSEDTQAPSFKFDSDEDKSSITSGSGFGAHSSPQSNSQTASQQIVIPQAALDTLILELRESKDSSKQLQETLQRVIEDFDSFKVSNLQELGLIKGLLEEDRFRIERMEEQMNDMTDLNRHQVNNLKQDMGNIISMEEKIEYRLDERTADIQDLLENCQTRITKMELQQQQQQIISMEMVENVTFRTILTKLINVVLALLAVILVFVSTFANLLSPFLATRTRILSTAVLVLSAILSWNNWSHICDFFSYLFSYIQYLLPNR